MYKDVKMSNHFHNKKIEIDQLLQHAINEEQAMLDNIYNQNSNNKNQ